MESYQVIAGFSDIKIELLAKTRTQKTMEELVLWFSVEDGVLYVHDFSDHRINIVLAVKEESGGKWTAFLRSGSYGEMLVNYLIGKAKLGAVAKEFNGEYRSGGFIPFGL